MVDYRLELVSIPVADVDRSRSLLPEDTLGWSVDHDNVVGDEVRFVRGHPTRSACSIAFGLGISDMPCRLASRPAGGGGVRG